MLRSYNTLLLKIQRKNITESNFSAVYTDKTFIVPTLYGIATDGHFHMTISLHMDRVQFKGPGKMTVMIVLHRHNLFGSKALSSFSLQEDLNSF